MADPAHVQEGLRLIGTETAAFERIVAGLDEAGWRTPARLPGWDVKLLTAHLTRGAEAYLTAIENGLRGDLERRLTPEDRKRRTYELSELDNVALIDLFRQRARAFQDLIAGLGPEQLDAQGAHAYGPRSVTWYVEQRLAEVLFHGWDLRVALGRGQALDEEAARYGLPMLLESNLPFLSEGTPGWAGALGIGVNGSPDLQWTVMMGPDAIAVSRGIVGVLGELWSSASAIGLLIYGRESLDELEARGAVEIHGKREAAEELVMSLGQP